MRTFGFQWHITDRCDQRCAHCYQETYSSRSEVGIDGLKSMSGSIFSSLSDREISVNLTGGEPFLFPGLKELVNHLHGFPNLGEIHIITSGSHVEDPLLDWVPASPKIKSFKVSIESSDRQINNAIRAKVELDRLIENIRVIKRKTGKRVVLISTLASYNVDGVQGLVTLAEELKADGIIFERFVPLGAGARMAREVLVGAEWVEAKDSIGVAAGAEFESVDMRPFTAFWVSTGSRTGEPLQGARCNLGDESMALMPNGDVYPCRRLPIKVGNVLDQPFEEILDALRDFAGLEPEGECAAMVRALERL